MTFDEWRDPYPAPVIEYHNNVAVVRDDLLGVGSKVRALDYLIGHDVAYSHVREWVFGACPATGYAQISLPAVCNRYDKKAVLFMAQRRLDRLHAYQQRGAALGADYRWVPSGMLTVTLARARAYVAERPDERALLPIGLEHPTVSASFTRVAQALSLTPDYVWSVASSGTLNRALQDAWPQAEVHVVSVGHTMSERERGRAIFHRSPYTFDNAVKLADTPPFPSALTYDAKAWRPLLDWYDMTRPTGVVLFWNVGA